MKDDNLFAETSMSFGEHLEELRKCLFSSLYWIVAGTLIGFIFGAKVVDFITVPVENSLKKYYIAQTMQQLDQERDMLEQEGYSKEIFGIPRKFQMVPVEMYLFPGTLDRVFEQQKERQQSLAGGVNSDATYPGEVDNLTSRKIQQRQKKAEIFGSSYESIHFDEQPIPILFWTKIENDPKIRTKALSVHEPFAIYIKASLVVGIVFASPFVAFHLWSFVAAGLYPHEKKYVYYFIPVSVILFIGGAVFAFFFVFQYVLDFLFGFNSWMNIDPDPRISEWIGFALLLPVGFGASFQLPLVMFVLERVGIFSIRQYVSSWRISVLAIFILALFLTPGDPGSMLLMAIPLTFLYFGGVFACWLFPRKKGIFDFDEEDLVE